MKKILKRIRNKILSKIKLKKFPVLETERLELVEITNSHVKDIQELFESKEIRKFYHILPFKTEQDSKNLIKFYRYRFKENSGIRWGITLKYRKNIIGTIGFIHFSTNHKAVIGYELRPDYWKRGYMTEALNEILSFGFNELNVNRIEAEVMQGNENSEKLLYKLSFKKEGVLKQWTLFNENHYDMSMFALLKSEFEAKT